MATEPYRPTERPPNTESPQLAVEAPTGVSVSDPPHPLPAALRRRVLSQVVIDGVVWHISKAPFADVGSRGPDGIRIGMHGDHRITVNSDMPTHEQLKAVGEAVQFCWFQQAPSSDLMDIPWKVARGGAA